MATQERLQKSLEILKSLSNNTQPLDPAKKKDKLHHCYVVSEAFSNPTIRISASISVLLEITIETFLKLCDDTDSDVRMTCDECLNRIIRAVIDGHIGKVQFELLKEIKRNGSARSLRAALTRFSQLAHYIRPHKGKAYVVNLFPKLIKITDRAEESVHETLASSLPNILKCLLTFSSDHDIKELLKAFLKNVIKPSAAIRRTAASCIISVCSHTRHPNVFVTYCINHLLDIAVPVDISQNSCVILGVLNCFKGLLGQLKSSKFEHETGFSKEAGDIYLTPANKLLQIYELCIHYLTSNDQNVVNAALDTLSNLLLNATSEFKAKLLNPGGIDRCRIHKSLSVNNTRSPSQLSVATVTDEHTFPEYELTETVESDIEKWIGESKLSVLNMPTSSTDKTDSRDALFENSSEEHQYFEAPVRVSESFRSPSVAENLDAFNDRLSEGSDILSEDKILECDFLDVDIGDYLDKSVPLIYCTRLIAKLFLLSGVPSQYLNDRVVRVSVKSSALSCLSSLFCLYPYSFYIYLDKSYTPSKAPQTKVNSQRIDDVMLLKNHPDPQIRGLIGKLASDLFLTILNKSNLDYSALWVADLRNYFVSLELEMVSPCYTAKDFVCIWTKGLQDENSNCLRQTLVSLKGVLDLLCESANFADAAPVLKVLLTLPSNPYWLVKVALCDLISNLSYINVFHVTQDGLFQQKVIYNVLIEFLNDSDQRIRGFACNGILNIIERLYSDDYRPDENVATTKGIHFVNEYLPNLCDGKSERSLYWRHFVENMPYPYSRIFLNSCKQAEHFLSKVVAELHINLLQNHSKYSIYGCVETLAALSIKFPCTVYRLAWGVPDRDLADKDHKLDNSKGLLGLCVSLLTSSVHIYDIAFLTNLMSLTFNLYAGFVMFSVTSIDVSEKPLKAWSMFPTSESLRSLSDQYLLHVMKLLNIFHHVVHDIVPVPPQNKTVLQHLPSAGTLSPIKRRKSDDRKLSVGSGKPALNEKEDKKEVKSISVGQFAGSQHYMKIFDALRSAFVNYKISLDPASSQSFVELVRVTVQALCVILEVGTLNEFGKIAEEILNYLKTTFQLDKTLTVQCVQQLLKCLFETNLTANLADIFDEKSTPANGNQEENYSFYFNVLQKPYQDLSACIQSLNTISKVECDDDNTIMGYLHRRDVKKPTALSRTLDKTLASYIRIFEPIVINSLKQYTVTSDVTFQCHVLKLLSQLVQLRINYCLLDSDQVFKDFVLKQFEHIEDGLVRHAERIIPRIFQFLVNLSYSKQHSKSIIDIPKIIQLCDGLMASGQDHRTHCIPALEPIVEDVFLFRSRTNTTDMKELETTREVILAMLLRLLEYEEVIRLVTVILEDSKYCTDDAEKWLRWSGQVCATFLNLLRQDKIRIENSGSFVCLRRFVFALNPNVFRPPDEVIVLLFQSPPQARDENYAGKWLSKIILLMFIISPLKEDELLARIEALKAEFSPGSVFENYVATADPLNVHNNADAFQHVHAEVIVARLIFRVVAVVSALISEAGPKCDRFLVSQFSVFLLYCAHIFQTGSLCKVSQVAAALLNEPARSAMDTDTTNSLFLKIGTSHPTVTFQYCHVLSLLNYNSLPFWGKVLNSPGGSLNNCLVKLGSSIVFCDYLNENISETKQLSWILTEHSKQLVSLIDEVPVAEFVSFVHRNSTLSKLFMSSMAQRCLNNRDAIFKTKILKCVENCHASQTGASIKLLVPKLLCNRQSAITRMVAHLASRKIEFLLTMPQEEVLKQISKEELFIIKEELHVRMLAKKHETLISLLNKVLVGFYDMSPLEVTPLSLVKPEKIRKLDIDKKWLLSQIQAKYQEGSLRNETAKVMEKLEYNELTTFMSSDDFNRAILRDCIERGVKMLQENSVNKEPPILKAAVDKILKEVSGVVNEVCSNHEVFCTEDAENTYTKQIKQQFSDEVFFILAQNLSYSLSSLMEHLPVFPTLEISEIDSENISKFAVLSLEIVSFLLSAEKSGLNLNCVELLLNCSEKILKKAQFCNYLAVDINISWLCSAIDSLHFLTTFLLRHDRPLPCFGQSLLKSTSKDDEVHKAQNSCHRLYTLTGWLYQIQNQYVKIPMFFWCVIKSLVICLARLPLINSYCVVPRKVLKLGWEPEVTGKFQTLIPPMPIDMLQEIDILEEYIFRTTLLGWTTRQQFEETWMCFLSVLCTPLDTLDTTDLNLAMRASSLAIKAITAQLLQTLRFPVLGNKNVSSIIHVSRNAPIPDSSISVKKLKLIQNRIENEYKEASSQDFKNVFAHRNFEKLGNKYSYAQMSIEYFMISTNSGSENSGVSFAGVTHEKRLRLLEESGLDVNSCLQFLLDYYSQLMNSESKVTDIRILHETVRSTLYISDLFTDKAQFGWMLDKFLALSKIHSVEDELLHQYLIVGICKAVGVLTPDLEIYEQTKKLLVQFLKSPFLPTRVSCLYGLLYVLEGCFLSNIAIGGVSEELQLILPFACEYVLVHLTTTNRILTQSVEHTMLTWALAFYIVENVEESHVEANFVTVTLQTAFARVQGKKSIDYVDKSVIKALERLLLMKPLYMLEKVGKSLQKLALEKMRDENPSVSILGVQLLITYMYVDCWEHLEKPGTEIEQSSPDHLVQTIEKISAIFDRVKKSYANEVKVLCSVLPSILKDFFSPSDILTKVIGEFLSPQQPHPQLMSEVVFQVFDSAIQLNQLSLLQDWVVFSLSNFTQSFSNMATWSLTCFFISASPNEWLKSFFPYVQARVGRYEYEDKKIFCIAGADFYKNLTNDHQRKTFVDNFVKVRDHPDMPFSDLLNAL